MSSRVEWHIITGEFPPIVGGTASYTTLVATALAAAGDGVHVWCPAADGDLPELPGVTVHRELGRFTPRDLRRVGEKLERMPGPRRIFVQWVAQRFGLRSLNVPFCLWLWDWARRHREDEVNLMVHEPYLPFGTGSWKRDAAAAVHRLMAMILLRAASRVWLSTPAWEASLRSFAPRRGAPIRWLPIPNSISLVEDPAGVAALRRRILGARGGKIVAHFGTFGDCISSMLGEAMPSLLVDPATHLLLIGHGSDRFAARVAAQRPGLAERVHPTGTLPAADISRHLAAADVAVQPYPDGITGRRSSALAALAHGKATVTTLGALTESWWATSRSVALAPAGDMAVLAQRTRHLLAHDRDRTVMGAKARAFYAEQFHVRHAVAMLRHSAGVEATGATRLLVEPMATAQAS